MFQGTFTPGNEIPGSESSRELSFLGAKVPKKYRGARSPWTQLGLGLGTLTLNLTQNLILTGQQFRNVTPCSDNATLLI